MHSHGQSPVIYMLRILQKYEYKENQFVLVQWSYRYARSLQVDERII
jgi:hypothetical protein